MSFTCAFCKVSYDKKTQLSKHIMEEHISKGNYSTEVMKYNSLKEKCANEKKSKLSTSNSKECELEEKVINNTYAVENDAHLEQATQRKVISCFNFKNSKLKFFTQKFYKK